MSVRIVAEIFCIRRPKKAAEYRFRIKARNGEIVCQSEGYRNKADAIDTARLLAPFVKVVEV